MRFFALDINVIFKDLGNYLNTVISDWLGCRFYETG